MNQSTLLLSLTIGAIISFIITRILIKQAIRYNIVDKPRADRFHTKTTALMGGIAIVMSFIIGATLLEILPLLWSSIAVCGITLSIYLLFNNKRRRAIASCFITVLLCTASILYLYPENVVENQYVWLFTGGLIIFFTGAFDDKSKAMEPKVKLFFQIVAGSIAITVVGSAEFLPPVLSQLFTFFWIIGVINALNLIDNMNGLSPGVAALIALSFGIFANIYFNNVEVAAVSLMLAAVLIGFLPNNFPNARIFMGDSGSMFLGYILSMIGVSLSWQTPEINIGILTPILLISYPIFDVTFVTINRIRSGRPIYVGGKDHSSHLLVKYGLSPRNAVLLIYALCTLTAFITYYINTLDFAYASTALSVIVFTFSILGLMLTKLHDKEYMKKKNETVIGQESEDVTRITSITPNVSKKYRKVD
ncbi:undecaprenyl/decaprenyl-phosphate alpha-N-acetylglucosaminyl 1-phosphate transferase [Flammeovirga yaeyamensis]|uniref:Undecaprenyl/decaprenyl-phosphate alpha-N-acetylglucosaminyl 1-phosphate transferase n=1 Tax=Flammeovirga yaeyamensis TaxID=367791 RepID=A0AAX1N4B7_9BACT|nr:MraY family glycosyltransferase [Flammeovirga yaeyamensis]MBB3698664.1 UDP-N-acetylmuramyl pentapeptide phosphotransferase/UDP-N-acetylglucosamine-1-phosphate transferase [Flammeovirga yaeyamensis]NMF33991.1 undecaprenyl/decaprenyl-phosphate alpha-N-acetylglucosaminyl 1-phosphate transferase [Flammeovirga yaeyamensis]QWG00980.1 undecaprenyl/decaprenyl-phosphate alpha-N-acetylglucosaminyl 1-phosphate transferase [Flammeovirga yaeyamensis]